MPNLREYKTGPALCKCEGMQTGPLQWSMEIPIWLQHTHCSAATCEHKDSWGGSHRNQVRVLRVIWRTLTEMYSGDEDINFCLDNSKKLQLNKDHTLYNKCTINLCSRQAGIKLLLYFSSQTGPPTRGGLAGAVRSTSTGAARDLASRNAPVASTGTARTQSTTVTATPTTRNGKLDFCADVQQQQKQLVVYRLTVSELQLDTVYKFLLLSALNDGCH